MELPSPPTDSTQDLKNNEGGEDIDKVLERIPTGYFHFRLLVMCGLAFMADAMEVNLLSFISTCAKDEWNLTNEQSASITGVVFAGIIVGSLFWGVFADRFGRRMTFAAATAIISIGGFLTGVATTYDWLIIFRAIVGFGIGGASVPFDLLAEFLPTTHRGQFLIYIEYFWTFGSLFVSGMAWATLSSTNWRVLAVITAIPVTCTSIYSWFYLPESPRWLLIKGKPEESTIVIRKAAEVNGIDLPYFKLSTVSTVKQKDATYIELLQNKEARQISLPLWSVWGLFGFTYYGLVLFVSRLYSTSSDSDTCTFDYSSIFINATAEIVGVTLCAICIDRLGRIRTSAILYVLSGIPVTIMGIGLPVPALLVVSFLGRMMIMAASSATWVSTPELYSTEMRTTGHAVSTSISKVGAFLSPYFVMSSFNTLTVGFVLGFLNVAAAAAATMLPETYGVGLDTLSQYGADRSSINAHLLTPHDKDDHEFEGMGGNTGKAMDGNEQPTDYREFIDNESKSETWNVVSALHQDGVVPPHQRFSNASGL